MGLRAVVPIDGRYRPVLVLVGVPIRDTTRSPLVNKLRMIARRSKWIARESDHSYMIDHPMTPVGS
jgi:hypothetical protein